MKISPKQYAQALYDSVAGKNKKEAEEAVKRFARVLIANNQVSLLDAILRRFDSIWNLKNNIAVSKVTTARELSPNFYKQIENYIARLTGAEKVEIDKKISPDILGGMIIEYNDTILDQSLRTNLRDLRKEMEK